MHESSIVATLLREVESVAKRQGARRVAGVKIVLGSLAPFSAEHLQEHFMIAARGTIAEGAQLHVERPVNPPNTAMTQGIMLESIDVES